MGRYTTEDKVGVRLRTVFNATTLPSAGDVEDIISEVEAVIEDAAGRVFYSQTVSAEYQDYNGGAFIIPKTRGITSLTSLEYTTDGSTTWTSISGSSYVLYTDYDIIELKQSNLTASYPSIPHGQKTIRLTYVAGPSQVPYRIKKLATDMAAYEVIRTQVSSMSNTQGGSIEVGPIKVVDPSSFSINYLVNMKNEIDERLGRLSTSRIATTVGKNWI